MKRRALLSACATVAVGGCLGSDRPRPRLAWIWLRNDRDDPHRVDVAVEDDGETVLSDTYELGSGIGTANTTVDSPVDGPGRYVVRASADGETRTVDTAEFVDRDENCVGVRFSLLDDGSVATWTKSMRQC